ncbi:MAG: hypothetical protein PHO42_05015 [Candidatus Omnitrophica bacterium]|nr:hypothetical protein [Candidatus Omnitrophota bacterium]
MKKGLFVMCALILVIAMAGCVRTYKFTKERVDTDVSGNQGVIYGPAPAPHTVESPNREMIGVDIELPTLKELETQPKKEK